MKYTASLHLDAWKVIGNALGQRPYCEVAAVILDIETQIKAQQQAAHDQAADNADTRSGAKPTNA
jgi:hypothetical protein